jgi:outer membrane protein insertion porin family
VISTSEKGFFSWITSSGELNREELSQDAARTDGLLHTNGFIHAKVAEPVVDFEDNGSISPLRSKRVSRFKVGTIDMDGELIIPKDKLMPGLRFPRHPFSTGKPSKRHYLADRSICRRRLCPRRRFPIDQGKSGNHLVDITYTISKGRKGLL